jgi:hypothetical protein
MNIRKAISVMTGAAGIALLATGAFAATTGEGNVSLTSGSVSVPVGTSVTPAAQTLLASETVPFNGTNGLSQVVFSGNLYAAVYQNTTTKFLTFVYQFENSSGSPDSILRLTSSSFTGFTTAVGQSTLDLLGGTGAVNAASTADRNTPDVVGFNFLDNPGTESDLFYVTTNATSYTPGSVSLIDGGVASLVAYAPAVPEPSTIAAFMVMGLGILALAVRARRRTGFTGQMA